MKTLFVFFGALLFLSAGCKENSQVIGPESVEVSNRRLITLPQPTGLSIENVFSVTKRIDGKRGGELKLDKQYPTPGGVHPEVKIKVEIKFDKNTFGSGPGPDDDHADITMTVDDETGTVTFDPDITFDKPAKEFYIKFEGLDLTGINPSDVKFQDFLPDGTVRDIDEIEALIVDVPEGEIELKLKNFAVRDVSINYNIMDIPGSRYGFSR